MCAAARRSSTLKENIVWNFFWKIWRDKEFLSLISENLNGSRHLVFWSLETLTGLRDGVQRLVA